MERPTTRCYYCGELIRYRPIQSTWAHVETLSIWCDLSGTSRATPA